MPPKASPTRRRTRASMREEPDHQPTPTHTGFQKPNLPPLQGTPSSRRQYSYGAAAEPQPARPGRGVTRGQPLDLNNAVRSALDRDDDEEADDVRSPRVQSQSVDPDEDELAAGNEASSTLPTPSRGRGQPLLQSLPDALGLASEADDSRSFGTESDFYLDATIASTPGSMQPPPRLALTNASSTPTPQIRGWRNRHRLKDIAEETSLQREPEAENQPAARVVKANSRSPQRRRAQNHAHNTAESDDEDPLIKPIKLRHGPSTSTKIPPPKPKQAPAPGNLPPPPPDLGTQPAQARQDQPPPSSQLAAKSRRAMARPDSHERDRAEPEPATNIFANRPHLPPWQAEHSTSPQRTPQPPRPQEFEVEGSSRRHRWYSRIPHVFRRGRNDNYVVGDEPAINWWQLLNPWTYARAMVWLIDIALDTILPPRLRELFSLCLQSLPYVIGAATALFLGLALAAAAVNSYRDSTADGLWAPVAERTSWFPIGDIGTKIGGYMPTISWSRRGGDNFDLTDLDGTLHERFDSTIKKMLQALDSLAKAGRLHDGALKKLEAVVPKVVHMDLADGKPAVAAEFWHALKELIRQDDALLTFDKLGSEYDVSSERKWKAIAARLVKDPTFTSNLNLALGEAEVRLGSQISAFWDTWVKDNEAKLHQAIGSAVDELKAAGSQREFDHRLGKIVQEHLAESERRSNIVSREEFLRHVKSEVASLRSEMMAEMTELRPQLEKLVRESLDLATGDIPPTMSRAEILSLVNGLVRKGIADLNLEALANGKIHAHWDSELKNQVNYFSVGAGAVIDAVHSSPVYDPFSHPFYFPAAQKTEGLRAPRAPIAALLPWQDEGDCFCASRALSRRGNPYGASLAVQLAHRIIPTHLVVEHILPGATTDPGARPREIEVYADMTDLALRESVENFSAAHFPRSDADDWDYTPAAFPDRFVKIAQFVYEGAELHDGVHVARFSSELLAMGAATDHMIVRAVSNYGAKNQTCFYRVRMYGVNLDLEEATAANIEDEHLADSAGWLSGWL
ncbi:hypothetical protein DCS_02495 [Drechmeria coniospora]|uniref:SUN domain-containing protein n=1 Tax=Drechmeria coniospora TaxID=98403 RepID=A0A151GWC9_DRECN|nr:hypothetical protein DCS_02495 [Drechmeria coniospora]KYK61353.1 hypothetical protein DCS_02495 [Drechmeria coniospora]ODA81115.1 hypothetical protein RJ55_04078 [Drechmeria coniospora]